jgi:DNA primase
MWMQHGYLYRRFQEKMAISRESIDRVVQAADVVSLIGDYVNLKKKGVNWEACCPFHEEKTPSFKVNPVKGIYKCFGCGKGGDSISFVMDIESLSYPEAIRSLARRFSIEIEESSQEERQEEIERQSEKESIQIVASFAQDYFVRSLHESEEGRSVGLAYFLERGLRMDVVRSFGLGYAPDKWDGLLNEATEKQYSLELLEKAGLILVNEESGKTYDRFRGRITFPIINVSGKVIAWGARMLGKDKNQPKYINSPEGPLYDKSNTLYGLFQARNAIRQADMCYLTEGYMDVVAMHQAGIANCVASSGTSLTEGQIRLVGRFTKNLTLLYDGDAAGIRASIRGIDLILAAGLNVRALLLPEGHDPDSYAKAHGSEALQTYLKEHSRDFISFKAELAAEEAASDPVKKAELLDSILESISQVPDVVKRSVFVAETAQIFRIPEEALTESLNLKVFGKRRQSRKESEEPPVPPPFFTENPDDEVVTISEKDPLDELIRELETVLLRNLVLFGTVPDSEDVVLATHIMEDLAEVDLRSNLVKKLFLEYEERLQAGKDVSHGYFLHHPEEDVKRQLIHICSDSYQLSPNWQDKYSIFIPEEQELLSEAVYNTIMHLKRNILLSRIHGLERRMSEEEADELALLRELTELKQKELEFARKLGTVVNS